LGSEVHISDIMIQCEDMPRFNVACLRFMALANPFLGFNA
jgi:hypothetical protein